MNTPTPMHAIRYPDIRVSFAAHDRSSDRLRYLVRKALRDAGVEPDVFMEYMQDTFEEGWEHVLGTSAEWVSLLDENGRQIDPLGRPLRTPRRLTR